MKNQNGYSDFMVRSKTFDRSAALDSAVELFSSRGYSETSMEDLVQATGVSRYGIYGAFGSKRELFEQALEKFADNMGRMSFLRLLEPDASLNHIRAVFEERLDALHSGHELSGCMLCHTAMEIAPHDDEIGEVVQKFMKRMSKAFSIGLENAASNGEVRKDLDMAKGGEFLTGTLFGMTIMARSGFSRESLDSFVDTALTSLAN